MLSETDVTPKAISRRGLEVAALGRAMLGAPLVLIIISQGKRRENWA